MLNASVLLADYAAVADGKLTVVGAGWTFTGPDPAPSALGILIEVPWDRTNRPMHLSVLLNEEDGRPVMGPGGPIQIDGDFEAGRPPGHPPGAPIMVPMAFNFGPLPLDPGNRYVWELSIDGETMEHWQVGFNTREQTS